MLTIEVSMMRTGCSVTVITAPCNNVGQIAEQIRSPAEEENFLG
jgi:hypothetical protein